MKGRVFLLGGYDLEMLEIKAILEEKKEKYHDAGLKWDNAYLSNYQKELDLYSNNPHVSVYGIELREISGDKVPGNYKPIDHHNDASDRPSALEQVADIIAYPLTEFQKYIAANDKGYIPAMIAAGANADDIELIRRLDRKAQGVSEADEALADKAIATQIRIHDIVVIESETERFSAICDRLYPFEKLVIYSNAELVYYGEKMRQLASYFEPLVLEGKAYYGGGENGYFGVRLDKASDYSTYLTQIIQLIK